MNDCYDFIIKNYENLIDYIRPEEALILWSLSEDGNVIEDIRVLSTAEYNFLQDRFCSDFASEGNYLGFRSGAMLKKWMSPIEPHWVYTMLMNRYLIDDDIKESFNNQFAKIRGMPAFMEYVCNWKQPDYLDDKSEDYERVICRKSVWDQCECYECHGTRPYQIGLQMPIFPGFEEFIKMYRFKVNLNKS